MAKDILDFVCAVVIGTVSWFFGGIDGFMKVLITLSIVDYMSGVFKAARRHELSSRAGFNGIATKVMIFSFVGIGHLLDKYMLGDTATVRTAICLFYIGNEGISILENAEALNVPFPDVLKKNFLHMKDKHEEKDDK